MRPSADISAATEIRYVGRARGILQACPYSSAATAPSALIDRCVDEASAGQGRLLLITGEAGIGKSTLAEAALERATAAGFRTARTHAVDDPGAPSLWPWLRLGRSLPEIRELLGPSLAEQNTAAQRFGVFDAVTEHLVAAAADSGLAVVLEDLHWADALSLALLRHVVADLGGSRLLLIGTARHSGGSAWDGQLAALHRGAGTRVAELEGLSTEEVRDWLGRSPDRRDWLPALDRLIQSTRGNPFYISLLTSAVPSAIRSDAARRDIVAEVNGRLRTLPADARRLVEIAAVAGDSASVRSSRTSGRRPKPSSPTGWRLPATSRSCTDRRMWCSVTRWSGMRSSPA